MLNVLEAIERRTSVRQYLDREVPPEFIDKILEAARLAPSASNRQPWYFIVVTDKEKKKKIAQSGRWAGFVDDAPMVIVGCGDRSAAPKWHPVDVSIAMEHMVLEATELGLGSCWVGSFDEGAVKGLLNIPDRYSVVALLSMGYPPQISGTSRTSAPSTHHRKSIEEIVGFNEYGGKRG
ncbi:MAG: nitroreductase family protein [Nitrososphaeria archaeon]